VLIANIIAWPIAYYAMTLWLQDYAFHIKLGLGTFILAGLLAVVISLLTVIFQILKAATANPVKSLRYE
jgi:putative ABC transport system permease protein